jgi:hypothetical protein
VGAAHGDEARLDRDALRHAQRLAGRERAGWATASRSVMGERAARASAWSSASQWRSSSPGTGSRISPVVIGHANDGGGSIAALASSASSSSTAAAGAGRGHLRRKERRGGG